MRSLKIFFMLLALVCSATSLYAQEFSADTVTTINGKEMIGKVYYAKDRWRIEAWIDDRHQITIIRKDKKLIWHIAAQQKQYLQFPLRDEDLPVAIGRKVLGEVKRENLGKDKINGRSVVKYKVYFRLNDKEGFIYHWVDDEYKIPIRSMDENGQYASEIKNIVPGPQAAALFELPPDVTPYTIPMGTLKKGGTGEDSK